MEKLPTAAQQAAMEMLAVPNALALMSKTLNEMCKQLNMMCADLEGLVARIKTPEGKTFGMPPIVNRSLNNFLTDTPLKKYPKTKKSKRSSKRR